MQLLLLSIALIGSIFVEGSVTNLCAHCYPYCKEDGPCGRKREAVVEKREAGEEEHGILITGSGALSPDELGDNRVYNCYCIGYLVRDCIRCEVVALDEYENCKKDDTCKNRPWSAGKRETAEEDEVEMNGLADSSIPIRNMLF